MAPPAGEAGPDFGAKSQAGQAGALHHNSLAAPQIGGLHQKSVQTMILRGQPMTPCVVDP